MLSNPQGASAPGYERCKKAGCWRGSYFSPMTYGEAQCAVRIWIEGQPCFVRIYHRCGLGERVLRIERGDAPIAWWDLEEPDAA